MSWKERNVTLACKWRTRLTIAECVKPGETLPGGQHPPDRIAAENIEHDVQIVVGPFYRSFELGNVPGPDLIGTGSQELGFLIDGMR
jgi:hypothetical protein